MNKFYIEYPRNFANEYNVYIVSNFKEWRFLNLMGDKVKKITRKEAIEKGYYLPRRAKRDNIQFYGGFYKTMLNTDLVDSIYQCIAETENLMLYIEFQIDEANKKKEYYDKLFNDENIIEITEARADEIIKHSKDKNNLGLFYLRNFDNSYTGIFNEDGSAWCEDFEDLQSCKNWLRA